MQRDHILTTISDDRVIGKAGRRHSDYSAGFFLAMSVPDGLQINL